MKRLLKKEYLILALIILIGGFLRFYNLMWGDGYFFHPDENNMGRAITQMKISDGLNPHFFAYGQFPLYLAYFSSLLTQTFSSALEGQSFQGLSFLDFTTPFPQAIFFLRFYSALFGTFTICLVYLITNALIKSKIQNINNKNNVLALFKNLKFNIGHLAAILAAFTPGLIQNSHFGTTESLLTFFFMLILYLSLRLIEKGKKASAGDIAFLGIICGTALTVKLTAVYFLPIAFLAILINLKTQKAKILNYFKNIFLFTVCCLLFALLFSPHNLINFNELRGSMNYETPVATGALKVFYTKQFENTTPVLFQLKKIFLYALGWPMFTLGLLGLLYLFGYLSISIILLLKNLKLKDANIQNKFKDIKVQKNRGFLPLNFESLSSLSLKKRGDSLRVIFLILFAFFSYLLPNSFLFAKWTRFIAPIFPFFAIFTSYLIYKTYFFSKVKKVYSILFMFVSSSFFIIQFLIAMSFFSIYTHPDSRVQASEWIYKNIPTGSYVLSETANVVDIPIPPINNQNPLPNYRVISFDFYHLDQEPELPDQLIDHLEKADYIFAPSRRIFANHLRLPEKYPLVDSYYQALLNGKLGFEHVATISYKGCKGQENSQNLKNYLSQLLRRGDGIFTASGCLSPADWRDELMNEKNSVSEPLKKIFIPEDLFIDDEAAEETWSVFDHPVIRIFKKVSPHDKLFYQNILHAEGDTNDTNKNTYE